MAIAKSLEHRLCGRVFPCGDRLFLVVSVNPNEGLARVSYRSNGATRLVDFPIPEILYWLIREREAAEQVIETELERLRNPTALLY